jgi:lia operon protein LiaF
MPGKFGKVLFWGGVVFLLGSVLGMMTFRFFLLAVLIHIVIRFTRLKKDPQKITPILEEPAPKYEMDDVIRKKPLFENLVFGEQRTPEQVYEWDDINIQTGVGDTVIDLSYTVLPKGETVIFIRNFIGNVKILIPYDIDVSAHHSVLAGSAEIFSQKETGVFNQVLHWQTPEYENRKQRVKIVTSMIVGDLEVKRV